MQNREKPAWWAFGLALLVVLILRIPALSVSHTAVYIARGIGALLLVQSLKRPEPLVVFAFCVLLPFVAWLIDLTDGAMSFVYGAAGLAGVWGYVACAKKGMWLTALAGALAACAVVSLGGAAVLMFGREKMTLMSALKHGFESQLWPLAATFLGGAAAGWIGRRA